MHRPWTRRSVACLALIALPVAAGCSSGSSASSTTQAPPTTAGGAGTTTTGAAPAGLPATGSVDGYTLAVTSSPITGTVGHTTIVVTAKLTGAVKPATLEFQVSDRAGANVGAPATDQRVTVTGPGTYSIPRAYKPTVAGNWASSVSYLPKQAGISRLTVSGLPPVAGSPSPFPQLVTVVTAA